MGLAWNKQTPFKDIRRTCTTFKVGLNSIDYSWTEMDSQWNVLNGSSSWLEQACRPSLSVQKTNVLLINNVGLSRTSQSTWSFLCGCFGFVVSKCQISNLLPSLENRETGGKCGCISHGERKKLKLKSFFFRIDRSYLPLNSVCPWVPQTSPLYSLWTQHKQIKLLHKCERKQNYCCAAK